MQLKQPESLGGGPPSADNQADANTKTVDFTASTSTLPFGQPVPLSSISGPTYVTGQLLVQQVAYQLSDKIFSYSPESFDLDVAVRDWAAQGEANVHGQPTTVVPLQTRTGAGAFALGYIFSNDFDISRRHIPQTLLAPSSSLRHLRGALDQLSLLYGVASPFVGHVAAADYSPADGSLVAEYGSAMQLAEELGLGLVASSSAYEAQHMSLLATLMAKVLPTLHIYDGVRATSRETLRVIDTLSQTGVAGVFEKLSKTADDLNKRLDDAGKVVELLQAFNGELGTDYEPFEYVGHASAETVLVVFGSTESQLAKQVVSKLSAADGAKVGVVSVRVYRPFIEEAFLKVLPATVQNLAVLGQVSGAAAVADASVQSALYSDVLAAVSFSGSKWEFAPTVTDAKYAAASAEPFTPSGFADLIDRVSKTSSSVVVQLPQLESVQQYVFWDTDASASRHAATVAGSVLSRDSASNVYLSESFDNLVQGGVVRTDIRTSKKSIDAPYAVEEADVVFVNDEKILKDLAASKGVKQGGKLVLALPNLKDEDVEKRVPASVRLDLQTRGISLFVLDSAAAGDEVTTEAQQLLVELAFLKASKPDLKPDFLQKLAQPAVLDECVATLDKALRQFEVPATWGETTPEAAESAPAALPVALKSNSFTPFQKAEAEEEVAALASWQSAAQALAFKEAYGTTSKLRPDQTVKTFTITVKENRRLTPTTYDRNIFHIEFDLGDSGLTYNIGEALGIHQENDPVLVQEFIESYNLTADAESLVQVPSRDDASVLETRTVYQSLVQNIDIFGKPPKRFYEGLAELAADAGEKSVLEKLATAEGAEDFKRRSEIDTLTFADILEEFPSARPSSFGELAKLVGPMKRREYSIASAQAVTPTSVALMIVVVNWVDTKGRTRYGQATRYLSNLPLGSAVTASVKPSVMKLPVRDDAPLIMAGLGTGLAPFRAFVQYRAMQKAAGKKIGAILLYLGSRHQREEYLYGEEWEAYLDAGVVTLLGAAFSRDQPQKVYIQDKMRESMSDIVQAYIRDEGSFYLCGPTWPVPDVTDVLMEAIATEAKAAEVAAEARGEKKPKKVDPKKEIDRLKEEGRYVLEVY